MGLARFLTCQNGPMTMVVQVKSASLLANITTGGKIMVTVDKVNWAYTVMSLEAAKP